MSRPYSVNTHTNPTTATALRIHQCTVCLSSTGRASISGTGSGRDHSLRSNSYALRTFSHALRTFSHALRTFSHASADFQSRLYRLKRASGLFLPKKKGPNSTQNRTRATTRNRAASKVPAAAGRTCARSPLRWRNGRDRGGDRQRGPQGRAAGGSATVASGGRIAARTNEV